MKKLKWILLIITIIMIVFFLFATCRKTKALESELNGQTVLIAERDQDTQGAVFVYGVANKNVQTDLGIVFFYTTNPINNPYGYSMYLDISSGGSTIQLRIRDGSGNALETLTLSTRLLQVQIVPENGDLYLIIYNLNYSVRNDPGVAPSVDGITRTMRTRYLLPATIQSAYQTNGVYISTTALFSYAGIPNYLLNYSYLNDTDLSNAPTSINNWVDSLLYNYVIENSLLSSGYYTGYGEGYDDGTADGEEVGFANGYDEGYDVGHNDGYIEGYDDGEASLDAYQSGYDAGYTAGEQTQTAYWDGYDDGQAGNTAITPIFNTLAGIFTVIGSVLSIELVPHVPIGLFILVPLFFAVIGLVLWIWRKD